MEKEYKYDAFISYRHLSPDKPIATRLQKLLETYTPPKGAVDPAGRRKLHLFRDESELPTSNDLGADIKSALEQSRYLVVICSPQFEKSRWCMEEVTYFKALHGGSNRYILPLLVDDPDNTPVFPDALRFETQLETLPDGTTREIQNEIEPLAANVSAKSLSQMFKRLKTEYLRIAAPLLDCGFDDLFRRDLRRRNRRRAVIFGSVTALLSTAAVLSTSALLTISSQKRQIEADAKELRLNNQELWMRESEMLEKDGDLYGALEAVSRAFPEEGEPLSGVIGQSVSLLGVYELESFTTVRKIRLPAAPTDFCILNEGKTLAARTASGLSLWNTDTGEQIADLGPVYNAVFSRDPQIDKASVSNYAVGTSFSRNVGNVVLYPTHHKDMRDEKPVNGENALYVISLDNTVSRISAEDGSVLWSVPLDSYSRFPLLKLQPGSLLPVRTYEHLLLLDPSDGTEKARYKLTALSDMLGNDSFDVYESGGYLIFTVTANGSINCVVCRPAQRMPEVLFRAELFASDDLSQTAYSVYNDTLCVTGYVFSGMLDEATAYFRGYDLTDGRLLWSAEAGTILSGEPFAGIITPDDGALNPYPVAFGVVGDRLFAANAKNGKVLFDQLLPGTAANMYYSANGFVFVSDKNGLEYFFALRRLDRDSSERLLYENREFRTSFEAVAYGSNLYAAARRGESEIFLYRVLTNDARRTLYRTGNDDDWGLGSVTLSPNKTLIAVTQLEPFTLKILDAETGKVQKTFRYDNWPQVFFFGNDHLLEKSGDFLRIVSIEDGETEQEYSNDEYSLWNLIQEDEILLLQKRDDGTWLKITPDQPPAELTLPEPAGDARFLSTTILSVSPSGNLLLLKTTDQRKNDGSRLQLRILDLRTGGMVDCESLPLADPDVSPDVCRWKDDDSGFYLLWSGLIAEYSCADGSLKCSMENPEAQDLVLIEGTLCVLDRSGYLIRTQADGAALTELQRTRITSGITQKGWTYESGKDGIGYLAKKGSESCIVLNSASFEALYEISFYSGLSKDQDTVYLMYYDCLDAYPVPDSAELRRQIDERLK